jgi:hypothetical protein
MVRFSVEYGGGQSFSALATQTSRRILPFVIPAKAGTQRRVDGKIAEKQGEMQSTGSSRPWVPAFAGMTENGMRSELNLKNRSKRSTRLCRRLPHTFARGSSDKIPVSDLSPSSL